MGKTLISLLLGSVMPLAFAPWHHTWIIPLLLLAQLFFTQSNRVGWFTFYFGFFSVGLFWTNHSIHTFGGAPVWFAMLLALLLATYCTLLMCLPLWLFQRINQNKCIDYMLLLPSLWVLGEVLRATLFTGFPWLLLGYAQTHGILAGWFPIGSVYLVSWLSVSLVGLIYWGFQKQRSFLQRLGTLLFLISFCTLSFYLSHVSWSHATNEKLTVTLVQGNTDVDIKWQANHEMEIFHQYWTLTLPHLGQSDLILWPETALTIPTPMSEPLIDYMENLLVSNHTTLILGLPHFDSVDQKFTNRLRMIGPYSAQYDKTHLLPFGDYIPFEKAFAPILAWLKLPMSDFKAGPTQHTPLTMGYWQFTPSICFEIAFANAIRHFSQNSHFIITASNDGWFGKTIGPHQHFQIATVRALENGRPVLRVTNTGITGIIDNDGTVLAQSPAFESNTLTRTIVGYQGNTPWQTYGCWPVGILMALSILLRLRYFR